MKRFRRYAIAFAAGLGGFATVLGVALAQAPSPTDLMDEANAQYERGEFSGAAQQYEALIDSGYEDAVLYYNLGNAYFKNGDLGRAVLNYLRAEELSPRDADIRANLEFARARTVDDVESGGESLPASVSNVARRWVTVGEMGVLSLLLWIVSALAIGALIVWRGDTAKGGGAERCVRRVRRHTPVVSASTEYALRQPERRQRRRGCVEDRCRERTG